MSCHVAAPDRVRGRLATCRQGKQEREYVRLAWHGVDKPWVAYDAETTDETND